MPTYTQMAEIAEKITAKRIAERTIELARTWRHMLPIELQHDDVGLYSLPPHSHGVFAPGAHNHGAHNHGAHNHGAHNHGVIDLRLPRLPEDQRAWLNEHSGRWHFDTLASTMCFDDDEDLTAYAMRWL